MMFDLRGLPSNLNFRDASFAVITEAGPSGNLVVTATLAADEKVSVQASLTPDGVRKLITSHLRKMIEAAVQEAVDHYWNSIKGHLQS